MRWPIAEVSICDFSHAPRYSASRNSPSYQPIEVTRASVHLTPHSQSFARPSLNSVSSIYLSAAVLGLALLATAGAQEIPRPSLSRARDGAPSLTRPYNLKLGPIALTASAGFGIEFVDNINNTATDKSGDIVLRPSVGIQGVWQVTKLNNLELRTTFGYTKYLNNPQLDSQSTLISPDSEIRLNIFVGDVKFILREKFSVEDDPLPDSGLNGVASLGRITNTIGITALWDLNDVVWSLGYDHYNLITTGEAATSAGSVNSNLSSLDRSTDQISTAVSLKFGPTTAVGIEATAGYSTYPKSSSGDYTSYSLGPYLDMQLTRYTHITLGMGYQLYSSEGSGDRARAPQILPSSTLNGLSGIDGTGGATQSPDSGGDGSGYYFNLSIVHRLNSNYQDRLSIGREFRTGLLSDRAVTTFVRYSSTWAFTRRLSLSTALVFEDIEQTAAPTSNLAGAALNNYRYIGASLGTSYQLTKKMSVGLSYQLTRRLAEVSTQDYSQNRFAIQFGYQF